VKAPVFDPDWPDEVKALYRHDMEEIWNPELTPQVWNLYHSQLELYCTLAGEEPKDILDVGCAQGTLALILAEHGHRVTAIDIRQSFLDYAQSRYSHGDIEFICGNALEIEVVKKFDVIFANQILEHLVYPAEFTSRLSRLLKLGGLLAMSTPNGHYLKNNLPSFTALGDPKQWEHRQFFADGDGHFFAYRMAELNSMFTAAGLTGVRTVWFESPWISGHLKFRYLQKLLPYGLLKALDRVLIRAPLIGKYLSHQLLTTGQLAI
jgi:2-polyprenyl-3-methyl-5-hydroxy-6-metoxy-1,4-benzoquinol methylase